MYLLVILAKYLIMNNPESYGKSNILTKRVIIKSLDEFSSKIQWKKFGSRILDIGCADGSTTSEILTSFIPLNYSKLIGCDISQEMVEYANKHYADDKIEFLRVDIASSDIPKEFRASFDYVFSFYTLHWVKEPEAAFSNIYDMLTTGGSCLLVFLGKYPVYEMFRKLARTEKWQPYIEDVEIFTSPYHDTEIPDEVRDLMERTGFKNTEVRIDKMQHIYEDLESFKNLIKSVNPFYKLNDEWDEFMDDYIQMDPKALTCNYQLFIAFGTK